VNPLETLDPTRSLARELKFALDAKIEEAKQLWSEFENERKKVVESGEAKSAAALKRLEEMHDTYLVVSDEAGDLQTKLIRQLGIASKGGGVMGDTPGELFAKGLERQGVDFKGVTTGGSIVPATFDQLIRALPQRQLRLRNLVTTDTADADQVSFLQQTVFTNAAAPVATAGLKPTSTITVQRVDQVVMTIAHLSEAVDRALLMTPTSSRSSSTSS
jgi:HK97 family phage major capsid protein